MDIGPNAKNAYNYTKNHGTPEERKLLARLSKNYCLMDPEAAGWVISEARARKTLLPIKAPPAKPEEQKTALSLEAELEIWSREESETEDIPPVRPIQELDSDDIPF